MSAIDMIREVVKGHEVKQRRKAARLDQCYEKSPDLLYFVVMDGPERFVKIGIASDLATRLSNLQSSCPYPVSLLKVVDGAWDMERSLHNRFSDLHVRGEWFRLEGELEVLIGKLPITPSTLRHNGER